MSQITLNQFSTSLHFLFRELLFRIAEIQLVPLNQRDQMHVSVRHIQSQYTYPDAFARNAFLDRFSYFFGKHH